MGLCLSVVSVITATFSFLSLLISALSFFLMNVGKGLSILFVFSKNQLLGSLIFFFYFFLTFLLKIKKILLEYSW